MPRLHSGRLIALDTAPLNELVNSIRGGGAGEMAEIRTVEDIFKRVEVLFFREADDESAAESRRRYRVPTPPGMEPYPSGYNLISIEQGAAEWDERDRVDLCAALNEARADRYFRNALAVVRECQHALLEEPAPLPETLNTWWTQAQARPARQGTGH